MNSVNVLMISDHLLTRCALQGMLEREKTIQIIGSGTLDQAQRVCRRREPDLLLLLTAPCASITTVDSFR